LDKQVKRIVKKQKITFWGLITTITLMALVFLGTFLIKCIKKRRFEKNVRASRLSVNEFKKVEIQEQPGLGNFAFN